MRRRPLLQTSASLLAALVAGCSQTDSEPTETQSPTETATERTTPTEKSTATRTATATDTQQPTATASPTATAVADHEILVDPDAAPLQFAPDQLEVATGETVRWIWKGSGHNIVPDTIPDGATWMGTPGGARDTYSAGYVYAHTFDIAGSYTYFCAPHRGQGMRGSLTVR